MALLSTFAKYFFRSKHSFYEKRLWPRKKLGGKITGGERKKIMMCLWLRMSLLVYRLTGAPSAHANKDVYKKLDLNIKKFGQMVDIFGETIFILEFCLVWRQPLYSYIKELEYITKFGFLAWGCWFQPLTYKKFICFVDKV